PPPPPPPAPPAPAEAPAEAAQDRPANRLQVVAETPAKQPPAPVEMAEDDSELRSFARKLGAASLPELLEASAAYTTLVRGQTRFSRRDIMLALDEIERDQDFTQEARIKSFGKLLRRGSIVRVDDGKFALSRSTRFSYEEKLSATG
ncbi:MAG: hypothetical protein D6754_13435, partial [Alphaproteobacteria bacterium]